MTIKKTFILFNALVFCFTPVIPQNNSLNSKLEGRKNIKNSSSYANVNIKFSPNTKMFPSSWYSSPIDAEVEELKETEIKRSEKIIIEALELYPEWLLNKYLENVYVLNRISFYGVNYGGTYSSSKKTVWVVNKGISRGYDDQFISRLFHAEFSSILLDAYKTDFDEAAFEKSHNPKYSYGQGGVEAIKNNESSEDYNEELNKAGFLNMYGKSDSENDFNSFSKRIFAPDAEFWSIVNKHPYLSKKLHIVIDFYYSIDPMFTIDYFRSISTEY